MRKYKVVVVGAGNIGALFDTPDSKEILTHANAFLRNEHFQLMGFFDVDRKKTLEAARRWTRRWRRQMWLVAPFRMLIILKF